MVETVSLSTYSALQGAPFGGMLEVSSNHHSSHQEPLYGPYYADQGPVDNYLGAFGDATLWLTRPRVRLIDQYLPAEPTPQQMSTFEVSAAGVEQRGGKTPMRTCPRHCEGARDPSRTPGVVSTHNMRKRRVGRFTIEIHNDINRLKVSTPDPRVINY
jgi:hypothetical protein